MHAHRRTRAARWTTTLTAPFALLLALPTTAHAATALPSPGATAPDVVVQAVQPGAAAFNEAVELDVTGQDGTADTAAMAPDATRFGATHLELNFDATTRSTTPQLTAEDVRRFDWLTIEYRDDASLEALALESDATFVSLGDTFDPPLAATVEALPADVALLNAGPPVFTAELFALSPDRTTVTPLNQDAVALVGSAPVPFAEFRTAAVHEWKAWVDSQPTDLPTDAIGGGAGDVTARRPVVGGGGASSMSTGEFLRATSIFVVVPGLLAFVLWERRRTLRAAAQEKTRASS